MTFEEYQKWTDSTARYPKSFIVDIEVPRETFPFYLCLGLAGEVGEAIEVLKKFWRTEQQSLAPEEKEHLKKELGDALWYWTQICTKAGLTVAEVMEANKQKLEERINQNYF